MTPTPDKPAGEALKACPFCGGEASVDDYSTSYRPNARPLYGVACANDDCPIEAAIVSSDRAQAVAAWNTRATLDLTGEKA